ncbi:hypothetical protein BU692_08965 [Staphylococcus chromogenes]|nr:hypothetical protein BU692_08965 [Staphylococcus chromogenes]
MGMRCFDPMDLRSKLALTESLFIDCKLPKRNVFRITKHTKYYCEAVYVTVSFFSVLLFNAE